MGSGLRPKEQPPPKFLGRAEVSKLLRENGIRPSRALGQNFVTDPNTVRRIARLAEIGPGDLALEIGAGLGSLTLALAATGASVVALELDRRLAAVASEVCAGLDVRIVTEDAMQIRWSLLMGEGSPAPERFDPDGKVVLVANLPYNIATPVMLRALEMTGDVNRFVVMVQREVGERWCAGPGDRAFGAVSVKVAWWASAKLAGAVSPMVFIPVPMVDSVLVVLRRRPPPPDVSRRMFLRLVEAGFATRRKMLRRNLAGLVDDVAFHQAGIEPTQRAEELSLDDWARLTRCSFPLPQS